MLDELTDYGDHVIGIGNCLASRTVEEAVLRAYRQSGRRGTGEDRAADRQVGAAEMDSDASVTH